jgi:hypothetical protein
LHCQWRGQRKSKEEIALPTQLLLKQFPLPIQEVERNVIPNTKVLKPLNSECKTWKEIAFSTMFNVLLLFTATPSGKQFSQMSLHSAADSASLGEHSESGRV